MRHSTVIIFFFFLSYCFGQSPAFILAKKIGGSGTDVSYSMFIDDNKNIFIGGAFSNTVDFDPGPGVFNLTSAGIFDLFFAKYDPNGNFIWARGFGGPQHDAVNSIAVNSTGDVFITGHFTGSVDFDAGPGITTLTTTGSGRDFYFAKYDTNGDLAWAKNLGGGYTDEGNSITIDNSGNILITGSFNNTLDFDPGPGTVFLNGGIFVAKYDSNGDYVWAYSLPGINNNKSTTIKLNANGDFVITGFFAGNLDFDPGPGSAILNGSNRSIFIAEYNSGGQYIWAKQISAGAYNYAADLSIDAGNNILLTGTFSGTNDFDTGPGTHTVTSSDFGDIFFAKYNTNGDFLWVRTLGGIGWEEAQSIITDNNNDIYVTGYFTSSMDFDPGTAVATLTASGAPEIFLAKYNSSGDFMWAHRFGASATDEGNKLKLDVEGNLYLTGNFSETVDFDPGPLVNNLTAYAGDTDVFFAKYSSTVVGINEKAEEELFLIAPNPCRDFLSITASYKYIITLHDSNGKLLQSYRGKEFLAVDMTKFKTGLYFVRLNSATEHRIHKIVKE